MDTLLVWSGAGGTGGPAHLVALAWGYVESSEPGPEGDHLGDERIGLCPQNPPSSWGEHVFGWGSCIRGSCPGTFPGISSLSLSRGLLT